MAEERPPASPLIVYVDDERGNRVVFEQSLKSEFTIKTVSDARSALELLDNEEAAVLVTDVRMPDMDGLELLRIVKDRHAQVVRMVITAYSDVDPVLRAINEGLVARYIVKPWVREELRQVLRWATELWTFGRDGNELQRRLLETERLATLGGFTALFVHDLKTPLFAVTLTLGQLRELAEAIPDARAAIDKAPIDPALKAELLDKIETAPDLIHDAKQASELLNGMVALLNEFIKPGTQRGEPPVIDPLPVVQHAVSMFQRVTVPASAQIGYHGPKNLPHVRMSPVELTQVLINLLNNATQAVLARGIPNLSVAVEARTQGDMLELQIRDQGVGMPPDVLKRVGTMWFTTRKEGTGLGLANCQRLIGSAGGRLRIESEPGVGTTVIILLPTAA